jgi:hypothetical protein
MLDAGCWMLDAVDVNFKISTARSLEFDCLPASARSLQNIPGHAGAQKLFSCVMLFINK